MRALALFLGVAAFGGAVILVASGALGNAWKRATGRLHAGDRAPDVHARDQDGHDVNLAALRGHVVALYFYPKDETPGCTREALGFREAYARIREAGAEVVGVSNDDAQSHKRFCERKGLPFSLLADPEKAVARAFGVRSLFGFYERITFLIDGQGVIRRVFDPVRPAHHADEVLAAIAELRGTAAPPSAPPPTASAP